MFNTHLQTYRLSATEEVPSIRIKYLSKVAKTVVLCESKERPIIFEPELEALEIRHEESKTKLFFADAHSSKLNRDKFHINF